MTSTGLTARMVAMCVPTPGKIEKVIRSGKRRGARTSQGWVERGLGTYLWKVTYEQQLTRQSWAKAREDTWIPQATGRRQSP